VGAALPATRELFTDRRVDQHSATLLLYHTLVRIPLGTVVLEETLFRGVLLGLALRRWSPPVAVAFSSVLFGLWHLLPARGLSGFNPVVATATQGTLRQVLVILLAAAATALVGVVFCWLRLRARSLAAPAMLHLAGNMLFLFVFGNNVEDRLGPVRYLIFYLVCGYLATYGFALADPGSTETLVGASGAIAGVLGAYLVLFPHARVTSLVPFLFFIPVWLPAWVVLGSWFVLQWLYFQGAGMGQGAGVAYLAHVVGFAAGVILILLFGGRRARRPPPPSPPAWYYEPR